MIYATKHDLSTWPKETHKGKKDYGDIILNILGHASNENINRFLDHLVGYCYNHIQSILTKVSAGK